MPHSGPPLFARAAVLHHIPPGYFLEDIWLLTGVTDPLSLGIFLHIYHPLNLGVCEDRDGRRYYEMCLSHILGFIGKYALVVILPVEDGELFLFPTLCLVAVEDLFLSRNLRDQASIAAEENPYIHFST